MTFFSEYIKSIITVGVCAFLSESVCNYFAKSKQMAKGLKLITNLCVFAVAISPIFNLFFDTSLYNLDYSNKSTVNSLDMSFIELTEKETENTLRQQILIDTGILPEHISIHIEYDNNEMDITSIAVTVEKQGDIQKIKDYLYDSFGENSDIELTVNTHEQN